MGAALFSLDRTKVLYATSLVLRGALFALLTNNHAQSMIQLMPYNNQINVLSQLHILQ